MAYHHGNLKAALTAAAVEILDREGIPGLTLRAVARRAGVSRQAPYNHFRNVDDLIAAVAEESFLGLQAALEDTGKGARGPRLMQEMGIRYVCFAVANPGRFRVMFGPQLHRRDEFPALARAADRVFAALSGPPASLLASSNPGTGRPARNTIPPGDPRIALWSVVHGLAHLLIDGQLTSRPPRPDQAEAYAAAATEMLWFGLGGKPGRQ